MKRWMACLISLLLVFTTAGHAENTQEALLGMPAERLNAFNEAWFFGDAHEYQHDLCIATLQLAQDAFRGSDDAPDEAIRLFFDNRGFSDPQIDDYAIKTADTIGSAISHRTIENDDSSSTLIAVAVCGGNYSMEWLSNFDVGTEALHKGFSESARKVVQRIEEYIAFHQIENPRFWITGYSRAAAVSNLTAAFLSQQGIAGDSQIFCYTFATPRTVIDKNAHLQHRNIFNIINQADLVPHVPLAAWGYTWYGSTIYLPTSQNQSLNYDRLLPAFNEACRLLSCPLPAQDGDKSFADKAELCAKGLAMSVTTPQLYADFYQPIIGKLITGEEMLLSEQLLISMMLMKAFNYVLKDDGVSITLSNISDIADVLPAMVPLLPMLLQHMPQIYAAWLLSMDGDAFLRSSMHP